VKKGAESNLKPTVPKQPKDAETAWYEEHLGHRIRLVLRFDSTPLQGTLVAYGRYCLLVRVEGSASDCAAEGAVSLIPKHAIDRLEPLA
jgi:hypothetical protein